ncbi:MAG: ubiquinone biosynthesis monooxygenase Coq7 [Pseudohongiellaceae bacterium]|jgi:ubiquinone biosynthesis monooxygenase Coq7
MKTRQRHSTIDKFLIQFDQALRTCSPGAAQARRSSPAANLTDGEFKLSEKKHIAGLMRINHTGEVCAQALYQGQAATAKLDQVRQSMEHAAEEEVDHLAWCDERLQQLDSRPSLLNPLWYGLSYGLGAAAGLAGDKWSLGFVAETEQQVCEHLEQHQLELPENDQKSHAILNQMINDEREHGESAKKAGGANLPLPIKQAMSVMSVLMKKTTYRL